MQYRSLTAEYSDYIQFFKRNRDLSEERKEKLRLQIQRCRNNLRSLFLMDYETWIRSESTGAMKLNRVSREIMAVYCPFSKSVREGLCRQPAFSDAFARFERERSKNVHDLELHYKSITAKGHVLPPELEQNLVIAGK